jgi:dUTP pyrophosphatase
MSHTLSNDFHLYSDKFFLLKIYLDGLPADIIRKYKADVSARQELVKSYINRYYIKNSKLVACSHEIDDHIHIDAGFDLYVPASYCVEGKTLAKLNTNVKTAMYYDSIPCGFYMYPRSSTGTKTPLRLANSVGVIDAGYRGNCIAAFDNISDKDYHINKGDRLVQICPGNLIYPIYPVIVDTLEELGSSYRGLGGFGSTGR